MFEGFVGDARLELTQCLTLGQVLQTFLTNPSKLRFYRCKIPTVITQTLIMSNLLDMNHESGQNCLQPRIIDEYNYFSSLILNH
jgi:hypothetical protein